MLADDTSPVVATHTLRTPTDLRWSSRVICVTTVSGGWRSRSPDRNCLASTACGTMRGPTGLGTGGGSGGSATGGGASHGGAAHGGPSLLGPPEPVPLPVP